MTYRTYSFMVMIDGTAKFMEMVATGKDAIVADLRAIYGEDAVIEIYSLQQQNV